MSYDAQLTVLGSLNMDISVTVPAFPAPGATVLGGAAAFAPGGKGANQAVAAARLGAASGIGVRMVGCVGGDDFGRALRAALVAEGVDDASVRTVPGVPTGIAMITVDQSGENMITVAPGANREVGAAEVTVIGEGVTGGSRGGRARAGDQRRDPGARDRGGALGVRRAVAAAADRAQPRRPRRRRRPTWSRRGPDWLVVNESEAAAVLGRPVSGLDGAARAAADLVAVGAGNAVVTAGAAGAAFAGAEGNGGNQEQGRTVAAFPVPPLTPWGRATRSSGRSRWRSRPAFRRGKR